MDCDLISIIVPVYNIDKYIEECIVSLIKQTYSYIEILLVDDGSTDRSGEICDYYAMLDPKVKVYHKKNGGLSDARNFGVRMSNGKYIVFVDGDDCVLENYIFDLHEIIINNDVDIACCGYIDWTDGKDVNSSFEAGLNKSIEIMTGKEACMRMYSNKYTETVVAWNKMYKRCFFEKFCYPNGRLHEDEFLTYKILYESKRVAFLDYPLYMYRRRMDGITGVFSYRRLDALEAYKEVVVFYLERNEIELVKQAVYRYLSSIIVCYYLMIEKYDDKSLYGQYKEAYSDYASYITNIPRRLKCGLYMLSPSLYSFFHNCRKRGTLLKL